MLCVSDGYFVAIAIIFDNAGINRFFVWCNQRYHIFMQWPECQVFPADSSILLPISVAIRHFLIGAACQWIGATSKKCGKVMGPMISQHISGIA